VNPLHTPRTASIQSINHLERGVEIGLGWGIFTRNGIEIISHNGGTGGYESFIGYDPKARAGVVIIHTARGRAKIRILSRQ
jgi:D-alanyl-D-alanine-carboxypeptidase/D-alanyl-D-alanine-endopeptidase